jgi:hypothetical protein
MLRQGLHDIIKFGPNWVRPVNLFFFLAGRRTLYLFIVPTGTTFHAGLYWLTFGLLQHCWPVWLCGLHILSLCIKIQRGWQFGESPARLAPYLKELNNKQHTKKQPESEN